MGQLSKQVEFQAGDYVLVHGSHVGVVLRVAWTSGFQFIVVQSKDGLERQHVAISLKKITFQEYKDGK